MSPQQTIAHYRITAKLGEGGMGEVWRATDTKLSREVAIKVLPEAFAADPDRLARFTREAQVLASLNHPNIAAIYGVEDRALIMELVEGADLSGPLSEEQALPLVHQLVDALEYAHEKGIVHRDLKPANIRVTPGGRLKVLDFGLAKAIAEDVPLSDPKSSPTLTMRSTQMGIILGTAAYMAPEQARGQALDKRADIWAFGTVVYEILTGKPLFLGPTVSDTLAAVLTRQPDLTAVPARFRRFLRACLDRDPRRRMRDIGDARLLLDEPTPSTTPARTHRPSPLPWLAAAVFALGALALAFVHFREAAPPAPLMLLSVPQPENARYGPWLALSPDGRYLGFTASGSDGKLRIWIRALDSLEARMLAGSDGVNTFFWSPDSRHVAFVASAKLKKMDISGGPPQVLCDGPRAGLGGSWNARDVIIFAGTSGPIMSVSASGGEPAPATAMGPADVLHLYPSFLSDGRHFLYMNRNGEIFAGSLDSKPSAQSRQPVHRAGAPVSFGYAPPRQRGTIGHLLFVRDQALVSQPFDEKSLATAGEPEPIGQPISNNGTRSAFSVSPAGMLAYRTGSESNVEYTWFDREGRVVGRTGVVAQARNEVALSPDGSRLAHREANAPSKVAVLDLARGIDSPLSFNHDGGRSPVWSPDGRWIAFGSDHSPNTLYLKDAANGAPERKILQTPTIKYVDGWSSDGRFLLFSELNARTGLGLWAIHDPLGSGELKTIALGDPTFAEQQGASSPDSRWLAFTSPDSDDFEIYVRPFPPGDGRTGRWRVSPSGGTEARWRGDGKELFYLAGDGTLMAVDVTTAPGAAAFQFGNPHPLFPTQLPVSSFSFGRNYDVARDGKRFLLAVPPATSIATPVTLVLNWEVMLKK